MLFYNAQLIFYGDEDNNFGSKEMTVNYIDELITTKILKALVSFNHRLKPLSWLSMRHNSREYLGAFAAKEKLLTVEAGMKSD